MEAHVRIGSDVATACAPRDGAASCDKSRAMHPRRGSPRRFARRLRPRGGRRALGLADCAVLIALLCAASPSRAAAVDGMANLDQLLWLFDHRYAYLAESGCDTRRLRAHLARDARAAATRDALVPVLERALECLHDPHATLGTHRDASTHLIPSGLQAWAEWRDGEAVVTQVRQAGSAARAGLRAGDRIVAFSGAPVAAAVDTRMPCCVHGAQARRDARAWALLALLAGTHDRPVSLLVSRGGEPRRISFASGAPAAAPNVSWRREPGGNGYIAVNDLGDASTVPAFDTALAALRDSERLFLDLRETPGGGNTSVAEPILGRLIEARMPYQRVQPMRGAAWRREVAPRGPWRYAGEVTVLVGRWTGSMGEGMAIGLHGMRRAEVCGGRMAGLKGAIFDHILPGSGIVVRLPGERLAHLDGTPREAFIPSIVVDADGPAQSGDGIADSIARCRSASAATDIADE